jgi:ABC-type transporter Mla subunit MlaD
VNFNKMRSYQAFVEFPFACGIQVGTQVRVRGVKVGNVLSVRPSLERVEAGAVQLL